MKAIVIDIDVTLTDEHRQLNCKAASAISRLETPITLASGNLQFHFFRQAIRQCR